MTTDNKFSVYTGVFVGAKDSGDFMGRWDGLWKEKRTRWDRGGPSMALHDVLEEHAELFPAPSGDTTTDQNKSEAKARKRRALVPGAGRGYDALLLASFGYDVYALDLSTTAVEAAKEYASQAAGLDVFRPKHGVEPGKVEWLVGDYFKYDFSGIGPFDLIYDYTFLCALPLEMRPSWSRAMCDNLAPKGRLVCLEFPTTRDTAAGGPPFALPAVVYESILARPGCEIPYDDKQAVDIAQLGPKSDRRLERLLHITPKRTHKDGCDEKGNVEDRVSVWAHSGEVEQQK